MSFGFALFFLFVILPIAMITDSLSKKRKGTSESYTDYDNDYDDSDYHYREEDCFHSDYNTSRVFYKQESSSESYGSSFCGTYPDSYNIPGMIPSDEDMRYLADDDPELYRELYGEF